MRGDQVDQLGHLDVLGRLVAADLAVAQIAVGADEEVAHGAPGGHGDVGAVAAVLARVLVGDVEPVGDVQVDQNTLQVRRGVVEEDLLEGLSGLGHVLLVVVADTQIEQVALREGLTLVTVVDMLGAPEDVTDCVARKRLRLNPVMLRLDILHDLRQSRYVHQILHRNCTFV